MRRNAKLPARLTVDLNCPFPKYVCSVSDGIGTAHGGFWKGFASFSALEDWLTIHGYVSQERPNDR